MSAAAILQEVKSVIREPYAWPGGYPRFVLLSDGEVLSPKDARENFRAIAWSTINRSHDGWEAAGADINWEDPELYSAHSGERIESAYAEPEDKES